MHFLRQYYFGLEMAASFHTGFCNVNLCQRLKCAKIDGIHRQVEGLDSILSLQLCLLPAWCGDSGLFP